MEGARKVRIQIEKELTSPLETDDFSTLSTDLYLSDSDEETSENDAKHSEREVPYQSKEFTSPLEMDDASTLSTALYLSDSDEEISETKVAVHLKTNDSSILSAGLTSISAQNEKESEKEIAVHSKSNDFHVEPHEEIPLVFFQGNPMDPMDKSIPVSPKPSIISHRPSDIVPSRKYGRTRPSAFASKSRNHSGIECDISSSQNSPALSVPDSQPLGSIFSHSTRKVRISNVNSIHRYQLDKTKEQAKRLRDQIQAEACKKTRGRKSTEIPSETKVGIAAKISDRGERKEKKVESSESKIHKLCQISIQKSSMGETDGGQKNAKSERVSQLDMNKTDPSPHQKRNADILVRKEITHNYGNTQINHQLPMQTEKAVASHSSSSSGDEVASPSRLSEKGRKKSFPPIQMKKIATAPMFDREEQTLLTPIGMKDGVHSLKSDNLRPSSPQKAIKDSSTAICDKNPDGKAKKRKAQDVETTIDSSEIASQVDAREQNIHGTARVVVDLSEDSEFDEFSSIKQLKIEDESKASESRADSWADRLVELGVLEPFDESCPQFFPIKIV